MNGVKPGGGPDARAAGAGAGPLPCLNSNNSIGPLLTGGAKRTAFALAENVRLLAQEFTLQRLGFLTLTFADHVTDIREAQRRFNSLRSNVLAKRYAASIAVVERMKSGRIHFHVLVVLAGDIRTGFDFEAAARGDYRSAGLDLRSEWAFWRSWAKRYGFGRTELMPVKSTAEGISKYVGKYIAKHLDKRLKEDKGARLVRYTKDARRCGVRFSWAGARGWLWRAKLAKFAAAYGIKSTEGMKQEFGPRWAFRLADSIAAEVLDYYPTGAHMKADGIQCPELEGARDIRFDRSGDSLGKVRWPHPRPQEWWQQGSGAKGAPARAQPVAPPAGRWEALQEAIRRGDVVKPRPSMAIVPGGSAAGA